ncbi:MAG: hypothetical protein ACQESR_08050 [Planctomycetota bacterium]
MESYPRQAVLPLVGLAADKVIRDRYSFRGETPAQRAAESPQLAPSLASADARCQSACSTMCAGIVGHEPISRLR